MPLGCGNRGIDIKGVERIARRGLDKKQGRRRDGNYEQNGKRHRRSRYGNTGDYLTPRAARVSALHSNVWRLRDRASDWGRGEIATVTRGATK